MRSRQSYAFLQIAGAPGLIAKDPDDYVALVTDRNRRAASLTSLNPDALFEDKSCVVALDEFLRSVTAP